MYKLTFAQGFWKKYEAIVKKDSRLRKKIKKAFKLLSSNPKHPSLKSHKVNTRNFGEKWASRVTGDIRIIWDFSENEELVILVLSLGGHSGKKKVYK